MLLPSILFRVPFILYLRRKDFVTTMIIHNVRGKPKFAPLMLVKVAENAESRQMLILVQGSRKGRKVD